MVEYVKHSGGSVVGKSKNNYTVFVYIDGSYIYAVDSFGNLIKKGTANASGNPSVISSAINFASTNYGKILFKTGTYWLNSSVILPSNSAGYCIEGEFSLPNAIGGGTVFRADAGVVGDYMFNLSDTGHSNNIVIRNCGFAGDVAVDGLLDLSQSASQSSRFLIENCLFYGTNNLAATSYLLNMNNNEDGIIRRCYFTNGNGTSQYGLTYHTPGGVFSLIGCSLGRSLLSGLSISLLTCIQSGSINIDVPGSANQYPNINLNGHWIESSVLGGPAINNTSGFPVLLTATGGRWNQRLGESFIDGTSPIYSTIDGILINSDDGTVCELVGSSSSHRISVRNLSFLNNARLSNGYYIENSGPAATITAGNTYVDVTHGLTSTPTKVRVTPTTNLGTRSFWADTKGAANFRININSSDVIDHTFDWEAEV